MDTTVPLFDVTPLNSSQSVDILSVCFLLDGLNLEALKYVVLDWNWRDQKLRRMSDIPEVSCCPLLDSNNQTS